MPQTKTQTKTPEVCTCAKCTMFQKEGKQWCKLFDTSARSHHAMTSDCLSRLPSESEQDLIPEEDRLYCQFSEGNKVKLIDDKKHHSEWESFVVVGKKYNSGRFKTTKSYLNEPTWFVLIATMDKPIPDQYSKAETDICHEDHSDLIETAEVF